MKILKQLGAKPIENSRALIQETREIPAMLQGLIQSIQRRHKPSS